ncbi:MAG: hypothetical protein ACI4I1_09605 [Oscillospiraceae bacterium]
MNFYDDSNSLFEDVDLDEMQKNKNYEIGFKLFRNFLYVVIFAAYCIFVVSRENVVSGISGALFIVAWIFYLIYAARAAKEGVMNINFAKTYEKGWIIALFVFVTLLWIVFLASGIVSLRSGLAWIVILISNILLSVFAKKNMRVLAEQIKEEE